MIEFLFTITYISNSCRSDMLVVLNRHAMQTGTISSQLVYWINKLVDVYGLMHWRVGCCVKSTCWLTFTDALTCWLVCWVEMLIDYHWCIGVLVGVLMFRHANVCTVLLNAIVSDQLLHLVIKRNKKKCYIFIEYSILFENLHSAVAVG